MAAEIKTPEEKKQEKETNDQQGKEKQNGEEEKVRKAEDDKGDDEESTEEMDLDKQVEGDVENEKVVEREHTESPKTPGSRPTREKKTVERFSDTLAAIISATKPLLIEKGSGTQLKDIPNVAYKLSKRKTDVNLQSLHSILYGKKTKAHHVKKNIGQFSGYVWIENEEKQREKVKEKLDKCGKEKLLFFCDILNVPVRSGTKKDEVSVKLLEFLESPHSTTDSLLADKEQKRKKLKRKRKTSKSRSSADKAAGKSAKKNQKSEVGRKRKRSPKMEEEETDEEPSNASDESEEDNDDKEAHEVGSAQEEGGSEKGEGEDDEEEEHEEKLKKKKSNDNSLSKKVPKEDSRNNGADSLAKPKKQKVEKKSQKENGVVKKKASNEKQSTKSSAKASEKQGRGKSGEKAKAEPSNEEIHAAAVNILKKVDFNSATLSDIIRNLGGHFGVDLMHRKSEVKAIITAVINNMSDEEEGDVPENGGADEKNEDVDSDA